MRRKKYHNILNADTKPNQLMKWGPIETGTVTEE